MRLECRPEIAAHLAGRDRRLGPVALHQLDDSACTHVKPFGHRMTRRPRLDRLEQPFTHIHR